MWLLWMVGVASATCMPLVDREQPEPRYQVVDEQCREVAEVPRGDTVWALLQPTPNGMCSAPGGPLYYVYERFPELQLRDAEGKAVGEPLQRAAPRCEGPDGVQAVVVELDTSALKPGPYTVDQASFMVVRRSATPPKSD